MIREDIENLNFQELNELEKAEYRAILVLNLRKVCLQLINSGDTQVAAILQITVNTAEISPPRLFELLQYAAKLYEIVQIEAKIAQKVQQPEEPVNTDVSTDDFPPLDTEKEQ